MKYLAIALIALAVSAAASSAAEEKLVPATEADFAGLLLGCWYADMWHADFVDGTESSGSSTICFRTGAHLSVSYDEYTGTETGTEHTNVKGTGAYKLGNNRLRLSYKGKARTWPFPQKQMDCDAVVRPTDILRLQNCTGDDVGGAEWEFSFRPASQ